MISYKCKTIAETEYIKNNYMNHTKEYNINNLRDWLETENVIYIITKNRTFKEWCDNDCRYCKIKNCNLVTDNVIDVNVLMREEKLKRILE